MKQVLDFLTKAGIFYLATTEDQQPHVRPVGFVMELAGRLAFMTDNRKNMYKQLTANPKVEICCYDGQGRTLRICGSAVFATSDEAQRKALEVMPALKNSYSVGDGVFEIYYLDEGKAVCSDMNGNAEQMAL